MVQCNSTPIQIVRFPFGTAEVYRGHTVMSYYYDPLPFDLQFPFINKKSSSVTNSKYLFKYLDSVIIKRTCDFAIVGIARNRMGSEVDVTIKTGSSKKLQRVRVSIDEINQFSASLDSLKERERHSDPRPEALDDFMVFADIEMF